MKIRRALLVIILLFSTSFIIGQKRVMEMKDLLKWNRIVESLISDNGEYIAAKMENWNNLSELKLYSKRGELLYRDSCVSALEFSGNSNLLLYKKEKRGEQSVVLYSIKKGERREYDRIKEFKIEKLLGQEELFILGLDSSLSIISIKEALPMGEATHIERGVISYQLADEGDLLLLYKRDKEEYILIKELFKEGLSRRDTLYCGEERVAKYNLSKEGGSVAFITDGELYLKQREGEIEKIASKVSHYRTPHFSPNGERLFYGAQQELIERDSSISKEEWPEVDIWNWREEQQFPQQLLQKKRDLRANNLVSYNIRERRAFQVTHDPTIKSLLVKEGDSPLIVTLSNKKYRLQEMWSGRVKYDIHIVNSQLERANFILKEVDGDPKLSPTGRYLYWYSAPDSAWFSYSIERGREVKMTDPSTIAVYNREDDRPDWPTSHSYAGWGVEDREFLLYDRDNIWSVDPEGVREAQNLTANSKERDVSYRVLRVEESKSAIDPAKPLLLYGFNSKSKASGYYLLKGGEIEPLLEGNFKLGEPVKAAKSESYLFTRESYKEFPDLHLATKNFKKSLKLGEANPQQKEFIWGESKLISWHSLDGLELQGVIYLPENFDSTKLYPMIVNFYERNSDNLHSYRTPEPHRSTIDYHLYNSDGYIIFNPDIIYREGYPGESAYNAVMPGIAKIIEMGFVDSKRIGAQGHSWGGYQVAYLATRSSLFAAIESGAPVVNMFSAYGGMRWGSGKNRSFQYEHQQSRIGATPWESPLRYIENSPLFTMDKVTTPILIMHNDNDGHVPWYQGIEYFVALKRLEKPVWLLNYSGEVHWPQKMKNKIDFQIRMKQFFDHYLQGGEAPRWMKPGLSAIELDRDIGY